METRSKRRAVVFSRPENNPVAARGLGVNEFKAIAENSDDPIGMHRLLSQSVPDYARAVQTNRYMRRTYEVWQRGTIKYYPEGPETIFTAYSNDGTKELKIAVECRPYTNRYRVDVYITNRNADGTFTGAVDVFVPLLMSDDTGSFKPALNHHYFDEVPDHYYKQEMGPEAYALMIKVCQYTKRKLPL